VRVNAVAPGGVTRLTGGVLKDVELKEPDEYGEDEFDRLNPQNSAPMVAWLASDQALHVSGQVFRAAGANIAHYEPCHLGGAVDNPKGEAKWDPSAIAAEVNAQIFHSRHPGLKWAAGDGRGSLAVLAWTGPPTEQGELEKHGQPPRGDRGRVDVRLWARRRQNGFRTELPGHDARTG
jgi:hypothetical protein